jgi:urease accessory protein
MRGLLLLGLALAVAGWVAAIGLGNEERQSLVIGLMDPLLGLDHFVVLLAVGAWAGRLGVPEFRVLPGAFLGGAGVGFLLGLGPPQPPVIQSTVHILAVAPFFMLIPAIVMPLRLSLREATSTVLMLGGCHGFVHGLDVDTSRSLWFGLGAAVTAAVLLAVGVLVGRMANPAR